MHRSNQPSPQRQAYHRSFAGRRFNWLQQILADRELPLPALHVAMVLANRLHSKPGDRFFTTWLFQGTIAAELGITDRSVRAALAALKDRGHLAVVQRGHHQSAVYKPIVSDQNDASALDDSDRNKTSALGGSDRNKTSGLKPSDRKFYDIQTGIKLPGQALVLSAAELVVGAEKERAELLAGRGDLDAVVRIENLAARALRRLGLGKPLPKPKPSLEDFLAARRSTPVAQSSDQAPAQPSADTRISGLANAGAERS